MARFQAYAVFATAVLGAFGLLHVALSTVRRAGSSNALPPLVVMPLQRERTVAAAQDSLASATNQLASLELQQQRKRTEELQAEVLSRLDRVRDLVLERCDPNAIQMALGPRQEEQNDHHSDAADAQTCNCPACNCPTPSCNCPDPTNPGRTVQLSIDADPGMVFDNVWDGRRTHVIEFPVTKARIRVYRTDYPGSTSNFVGQEFWGILQMGWWEIQTIHVYRRCIGKGSVVVDFGSWVGPTVLFAATLGAKQVYGIEPDTVAFEELRANVYRNPHLAIDITYGCISNANKLTQITTEPNNMPGDSMSKIAENMATKGARVWEVMCYEWTSFLKRKEITHIDFIKWDCEGCEELVGDHIIAWLATQTTKPHIYFSLHRFWWQGSDLDMVMDRLLKLFQMYKYVYRCNMISADPAPAPEILLQETPYTRDNIDWTQSYLLTDQTWEALGKQAGVA